MSATYKTIGGDSDKGSSVIDPTINIVVEPNERLLSSLNAIKDELANLVAKSPEIVNNIMAESPPLNITLKHPEISPPAIEIIQNIDPRISQARHDEILKSVEDQNSVIRSLGINLRVELYNLQCVLIGMTLVQISLVACAVFYLVKTLH